MAVNPAVVVLMATYNGIAWLPEQVETILNQQGVDVELVVSDDGSDDGTWEWLGELATHERRVRLLEQRRFGDAARNFYRLLTDVDTGEAFVALADQDDRWLPGKLAAQAELLASGRYAGTSSDVTAFDEHGRRHLIRKSDPQVGLDYLFESPGPGCSFLLSPKLAALVREQLADSASPAARVDAHDCLIYAIARAAGLPWLISDVPWVDYRQHARNAMGANVGVQAALERLRRVRRGWHRGQARKLTDVALAVADSETRRHELLALQADLDAGGLGARARLAGRVAHLRRRRRDRWALAVMIGVGLW